MKDRATSSHAANRLAAVIDAQCLGGYTRYRFGMERNAWGKWCIPETGKILLYLLDPKGLKAIWGEERECWHIDVPGDDGTVQQMDHCDLGYKIAAKIILEGWLSGGSMAAIEAAYALLPKAERGPHQADTCGIANFHDGGCHE